MPKGYPLDLTDQRFGRWRVLGRAGVNRVGKVMWACRCECGNTGNVPTGNLRAGMSQGCRSCGNAKGHSTRQRKKGKA